MRLDVALFERKLAESRQKAQQTVKAGLVRVNSNTVTKPAFEVTDADEITVVSELCPYVGRGGWKLEAALDTFGIDVSGLVCADIGASTGGFTDCLLSRGAAKVYAVDSGHGQLAPVLQKDARVVSLEDYNARNLTPDDVGGAVPFLCCDVSFISVTLLFSVFAELLNEDGRAVVLIKPQFEVGRSGLNKNGIVRDPKLHRIAVSTVCEAARMNGLIATRLMRSPIEGGSGNREFLVLLQKCGTPVDPDTITRITLGK